MAGGDSLAGLLLDAAQRNVEDEGARAALEAALQEIVAQAGRAWPGVRFPSERFVRILGERLPPGDPRAALESVHAVDLYLACACADGDRAALSAFDGRFLVEVAGYLARTHPSAAFVDEVQQALRARLFVPLDEKAPRILSYDGRGPLGAWLRMIAVRLAST